MADDSLQDADRSGAMLAHLSGYAGYLVPCGGVLVPLLIAFLAQSRVVATVARQALLLNVLGFLSMIPVVGAYFLALGLRSGAGAVLVAIFGGLWALVVIALVLVCPLVGAIKASGGRSYQYPIFGIPPPQR